MIPSSTLFSTMSYPLLPKDLVTIYVFCRLFLFYMGLVGSIFMHVYIDYEKNTDTNILTVQAIITQTSGGNGHDFNSECTLRIRILRGQ